MTGRTNAVCQQRMRNHYETEKSLLMRICFMRILDGFFNFNIMFFFNFSYALIDLSKALYIHRTLLATTYYIIFYQETL